MNQIQILKKKKIKVLLSLGYPKSYFYDRR